MGRFSTEDPIFDTEEPFRNHYSPDELKGRDDKLDELAKPLQPVMRQEPPKNVFVYGNQGAGKTACVNHILEELKEEVRDAHDEELTVVQIQCRHLNSTYQLAIEIINELREKHQDEHDTFPETGHPKPAVYNNLYDELENAGSYVILVLDEFDEIEKDRDEFLRNISRALAEGKVTDTKPGIITITNGYRLIESLNPETKDSLDAEEITFEPYEPDQLNAILEDRAEKAFNEGAVGEGVIQYCAAVTAKHSGSARYASQLLHKAGLIARDEDPDAETVQGTHVETAEQQLSEERRIAGIRDLDVNAHLALVSLIEETGLLDGKAPKESSATTSEIYEYYTQLADSRGLSVLSNRRFHERLKNLNRKGYVEQTKTFEEGHSNLYKLDIDIETAVSALEQSKNEDIPPMAKELRENAEEQSVISTAVD